MPDPVAVGGDVVDRAAAFDALGQLVDDRAAAAGDRGFVALLDEQPVVGAVARPALQSHQHPVAVQLLAVQREFEHALFERLLRIALQRLPGAAIPQQHRAAAVFALRDHPLEPAVVERMVLDLDRQAFFVRVEARAFRDRPAFQNPVELQPEIVVQPPRRVLLDDVGQPFLDPRSTARGRSGRLRRLPEIAFLSVEFEDHGRRSLAQFAH